MRKMKADKTYLTSSLSRIFCLGLLSILTHSASLAGTTNVTVNVNDQVVWTWVSDFHSTQSDTDLWNSGVHNQPFSFTNTFTSTGSFPYFCIVHGFTGTVNVQGAGGGS